MPIIKSAKKRVRVSAKATIRNAKTKRTLRDAVKAFRVTLASGKSDAILKAQNEVNKAIDIAAKKNVIHKNKAARKKRQISTQVKAAGVKLAKKSAVKKPVPKKTVIKTPVKKAATKKVVAKKAPAKKPVAKKKS
jgi:small subunit ribosomal protein S20